MTISYYYYYYYYYKSKDFSDASQKVAGALYKVTVCAGERERDRQTDRAEFLVVIVV